MTPIGIKAVYILEQPYFQSNQYCTLQQVDLQQQKLLQKLRLEHHSMYFVLLFYALTIKAIQC